MKKIFIRLLPLLLGVLFLFGSNSHVLAAAAAPLGHTQATRSAPQNIQHPASQTCNPCESGVQWTAGTTGGGQTTTYIPNLTLSGSDYLVRTFEIDSSDGLHDSLVMGVEFNADLFSICNTSKTTGQFFIGEFSSAGALNYHSCKALSTWGYNGQFYTNPSGTSDQAYGVGCSGGICPLVGTITNVQSNLAASYTEVREKVKTTVNGTFQGSFEWIYNEYWHNGYIFQSSAGSLFHITTPAVQADWDSLPNGLTNHGGDLSMCEKDSGTEDINPGC